VTRRRGRPALSVGASIPAIVRAAHRGARIARWGEAALLAVGGLTLTLAAAELSGGGVALPASWVVASFAAALVAVSWLTTTHRTQRETASQLDRRLDFSGALLTAYEQQESERASELVALLAARVAARVTPGEALRVARPLTAFPIVAPFLGAALLALAVEATRPDSEPPPLAVMARGMSDKLALARGAGLDALDSGQQGELGEDPAELLASLTELLSEVAELEAEWSESAPDPKEATEAIEGVEQKLSELQSSLPADSALELSLRELSMLVDAAGLRAHDADRGGGAAESWRKADTGSLASPGPSGRIAEAGSTPGGAGQSSADSAGVPTDVHVRGALVSAGWRPEYDEIVALWVESRRVVDNSEQ